MLFAEMLHKSLCLILYRENRYDTGHVRYHYISNSRVSIGLTPASVLAGWPVQLLVFVIDVSCKHEFLFPSSSSPGLVIGVDRASAKRPKTQNKWQKQQGGCAGNTLSQHGRLWDLHAIHLSNCIRANSDCCRIGTANFAGNRNFSDGSVSRGFTPGGQRFASGGLPQYAATTTKQQQQRRRPQ